MSEDSLKTIDALLQKIKERNHKVQKKKQSTNPLAWISAIILSLLSLVGIGVAMWYARRQGKELARARTELELQKIEMVHKKHRAYREMIKEKKHELWKEAKLLHLEIDERNAELSELEEQHETQVARIKQLRSWKQINEG